MKTCVVHLTPVAGSMQASARVARFVADTLKVPLLDDHDSVLEFWRGLPEHTGQRDLTMLMVNGPIAFSGIRDQLGEWLLPRTQRCVFLQQDYTITMPPNQAYSRPTKAETPFRAEFHSIPEVNLWSTCQDVLAKRQAKLVPGYAKDEYVNWNALTYAPADMPPPESPKLLYYGALRADREAALRRFFDGPAGLNTVISMSNPNKTMTAKWIDIVGNGPGFVGPLKGEGRRAVNGNRWGEQALLGSIGAYQHALYIADDASNGAFHSLANRFYEALSTPATVLWLDAAGAATYEKAGLRGWENYAVADGAQLAENMTAARKQTLRKLADSQRKLWLTTDPFKDLQAKVRQLGRTL